MIEVAVGAVALLFLLGSGLFSGCELGIFCLNRVRLRLLADGETLPDDPSRPRTQNQANARVLLHLANNQQETVLAVLLWQNLCGYLLTVATSWWLAEIAGVGEGSAEFYTAVILTPVIFVFDVVPKNWFQMQADRLMYGCAKFLRVSVLLLRFTGIVWALQQLARISARWVGEDEQKDWLGSRGEVLGLLREGAAQGLLSEEQTQIVERVLNLSHVQVRSIMIPRRRVVVIPANATRHHFESIVRGHNFSRMPVITPDQRTIAGVVNVAEVLADDDGFNLQKHLQPPLKLNMHASAANALVRLQQGGNPMALVTDPRNEFIGIVTLKDVVEEIFGELPAW